MADKPGDFSLPQNVINKILSDALPSNVNIDKDARSALGKAASIFILYCTNMASNAAQVAGRTNLVPQDVLDGASVAGFDDFAPVLKEVYHINKREMETKKEQANQRRREQRRQKKLTESQHPSSSQQDDQEEESDSDEEEVVEVSDEDE